jgi:two-component system sensor histidine kinase BaeS
MSRSRPKLATRLMAAQTIVVGIGAVTLAATATLVAPGLFHEHLTHVGVDSPAVQAHAEEAFATSFAISVAVAAVTALIAAGLASWFLVRRVSRPVEELAVAARSVAAGQFDVDVPDAEFSSELHQLSESFSDMASRLAETEASRSRMLADLAHELRTPLATLEAYIDGLEDDVLPRDAASWSTMRDQVARLRRLSGDLREAAAAEEHALGIVLSAMDARDAAETAVTAAAPRYQAKGVRLEYAHADTPCRIRGDSQRLQQVLANLLDNSLRHCQSGDTVDVVVDQVGATVRVRVIDTGEGIPVDQLGKVFDRFHRVDPSRLSADGSGSGLGLTIARAIVTEHDGSLTAVSDGAGQGTTFTMALPASH